MAVEETQDTRSRQKAEGAHAEQIAEIEQSQANVQADAVSRQSSVWPRLTLLGVAVLVLMMLMQPVLRFSYSLEQLYSTLEDERLHGFYGVETGAAGEQFVWTEPRAYIPLDYHSSMPVQVTLQLRSAATTYGPDAPVRVLANGREVAKLHPDPANTSFQPFTLRIVPPPGNGQLKLELVTAPYKPGGDDRVLGIMIAGVSLDKSEAWSVVWRRIWLYWALPILAALAWALNWAAHRYRRVLVGYAATLACLLGAGCAAIATLLVLRAGPLDWATFPIWLGGSVYLLAAFTLASLALPLGLSGGPSVGGILYGRLRDFGFWILDFGTAGRAYKIQNWQAVGALVRLWRANLEPASMWLGWRLALFVVPIFAGVLFGPAAASLHRVFSPNVWMERLVWTWTRWDGVHYLDIAANGYQNADLISFYPLYPIVIRLASTLLTPGDSSFAALAVTGIVVSSASALVACVLLYRLALLEYDRRAARLSVLYLLSFPMAFFLFAVFTEGLFLALAVGAFYAARTRRWALALALAALAALARNQGIFVAAALVVEYGQQVGWKRANVDRRVLYFSLPALAYCGWLVFNWLLFGNFTQFTLAAKEHWGHDLMLPWQTMANAAGQFFRGSGSGTWLPSGKGEPVMYEFPMTVAFLVIAVVGLWATWKGRLRPAYMVFIVACLLQPLTFPVPGNELISMPRYELIIFPAFFLLALGGRRSSSFHYGYLALSLSLLGLFLARYALWFWVA